MTMDDVIEAGRENELLTVYEVIETALCRFPEAFCLWLNLNRKRQRDIVEGVYDGRVTSADVVEYIEDAS